MLWGRVATLETTCSSLRHDLHATILRLMGIDHERFKYNFKGLDLGLTGVESARILPEIVS